MQRQPGNMVSYHPLKYRTVTSLNARSGVVTLSNCCVRKALYSSASTEHSTPVSLVSGKTGGDVGSQRQFDVGSSTITQASLVAEGKTQFAVEGRRKLR